MFSKDMNISKTNDDCSGQAKTDVGEESVKVPIIGTLTVEMICLSHEFDCPNPGDGEELDRTNQSAVNVSQILPIGMLDKKNATAVKELESVQKDSFETDGNKEFDCHNPGEGEEPNRTIQSVANVSQIQPIGRLDKKNATAVSELESVQKDSFETVVSKEFDCHNPDEEEPNRTNQSVANVSQIQPIGRLHKKDAMADKERESIQKECFVVSSEAYRTLLNNLYLTRLCFLRDRNITMNQISLYKKEAIGHIREIKRIVYKELENPEVSGKFICQELVNAGIAVIRNQQALNRKEMIEFMKNLERSFDTLSQNVEEVKSVAELEYEVIQHTSCQQTANGKLFSVYGSWNMVIICVLIILMLGLFFMDNI